MIAVNEYTKYDKSLQIIKIIPIKLVTLVV